MTNMKELKSIVSEISELRKEIEETNAYDDSLIEGLEYKCDACTEEHLCTIHCAACLDQFGVCERLEEIEEKQHEADILEQELILINNEKRELLEAGIKGCSECIDEEQEPEEDTLNGL